jgi:hypothetical protein
VRLFELAHDPREHRDRAAELPVWRGYLESLLRGVALGETRQVPSAEVDPELRQQLEALGYL